MSPSPKFWLNIDKPTTILTLHHSGCTYASKKSETEFKGINKLKRDGGWMSLETRENAKAYTAQYPHYAFRECKRCS